MIKGKHYFPDTFNVVVGINYADDFDVQQFIKSYNIVNGTDEDEDQPLYFGRLVHFSINIYDKDEVLSDDNPPIETLGYTSNGKDFKNFFNYSFDHNFIKSEKGLMFLKKKLEENKFITNPIFNVFKNCTDTKQNEFYVLDNISDINVCKKYFTLIREWFLEASAFHWIDLISKKPDAISECPLEILKYVKPKLKGAIDVGIMDESIRIKNFQQFNDSRVWEPLRKSVKPHNMPSSNRQNDYLITVKEEIAQILKNLYNFSQENIDSIQNIIWLELKNEWQDILDDSLVNWDTPNVCAQKCLTKMKEFIPLIEES